MSLIENRWNDAEAARVVAQYAAKGVAETLALRVYTSRLIGGDTRLVLHGGGNTSAKGKMADTLGDQVDVLWVKGSGWDLATIEPQGFPAVRLEPLLRMRPLASLSDEGMVNALRTNLLEASAPTPSVEALLHAFLPHPFVDHTHADAVLALVDQPDPEARCQAVYGDKLAVLPFVFPGFSLAGRVMELFEKNPRVEGIVLVKHGLFTFGDSAKQSYERMVAHVSAAQAALNQAGRRVFAPRQGIPPLAKGEQPSTGLAARLAPYIRGALAEPLEPQAPQGEGWRRWIVSFRTSPLIREYVDGEGLADYARRGVVTPDHIIRTKNLPLVADKPPQPEEADFEQKLAAWGQELRRAVEGYRDEYHAYFERCAAQSGSPKKELDRTPRVVLVPGVGVFAAGATHQAAQIALDLVEHTVEIVSAAEGLGRYTPLPGQELFEMEYWSLEQAKLGKGAEKPLARQVALVTGAGSGIGRATALAFAREGAQLAITDLSEEWLASAKAELEKAGAAVVAVAGNATQPQVMEKLLEEACLAFGGVDILVANAGKVWQGPLATTPAQTFRESFELNFFAQQEAAAAACRLMLAQATGGQLLFNASKAAFNPGPNMGPYAVPKAAIVALMKQYALDYGDQAIRANAINADRVNTNLFGQGVLEQRAQARGLAVSDYLSANLLKKEVLAQDVAKAFVALALSAKTTGAVLPVDGGNIAAAPR